MLVVDASVAYKWVVREPDSAAARALIGTDLLVAPELVLLEVANALWKGVRRAELAPHHAQRGNEELAGLFDRLYPVAPLVRRAAEAAHGLDHPVYDCIYLALAETEASALVTADARLIRRVAGTPWAPHVRDLSSFPAPP